MLATPHYPSAMAWSLMQIFLSLFILLYFYEPKAPQFVSTVNQGYLQSNIRRKIPSHSSAASTISTPSLNSSILMVSVSSFGKLIPSISGFLGSKLNLPQLLRNEWGFSFSSW
jgi:hypothetical protein